MAQHDQGIYNVHGQGRFIDGAATGETFVDFGQVTDNRYVRVRVFAAEDGAIEVHIDGEMCAHFNDAPQLRVVINGETVLDSGDGDLTQPEDLWMPPRDGDGDDGNVLCRWPYVHDGCDHDGSRV